MTPKGVQLSEGNMDCAGTNLTAVNEPRCRSLASLSLSEFDYESRHFEHDNKQLHYIDTGPGPYQRTALCLHSRYGWSFAFRRIIPILVQQGFRVVATDLLGFGLSDKTNELKDLSISAQCARVVALIEELGLQEIMVIGHEMGGGIAASLPRLMPERINALVFANPAGRIFAKQLPGLHLWQRLLSASSKLGPGWDVGPGSLDLTDEERRAYRIPATEPHGTVAMQHFHNRIVLQPEDPDFDYVRAGYDWLATHWSGTTVTLVGRNDPVFGLVAAERFCRDIRCENKPIELPNSGAHPFEDNPECIMIAIDQIFAA